MSDLLEAQLQLARSVTRSLDNFKKIGRANLTAAKIRNRIANLRDTWTQLRTIHLQLMQQVPAASRATISYFKDEVYDSAEESYQIASDYMAECLEELEPHVSHSASNIHESTRIGAAVSSAPHRLPTIKLPPFNGEFGDWESFRDRFTALIIENPDLSDFSKMHYLTSCLKDRALECIKSLSITAASFPVAWNVLKTRFENKRRLIHVHLNAILSVPVVSRESGSNLQSLRDKITASVAALKNLHRRPEELWDDMLVFLVTQRLDPSTKKAWALKFADEETSPSFQDMCEFLDKRLRAAEVSQLSDGHSTHSSKSKPKVSSATASPQPNRKCSLCQNDHAFPACPQFLSKTPTQRRDLVKSHRRCFNCLSAKHHVLNCSSKYTCRFCNQKHHSLLHENHDPPAAVAAAPASSKLKTENTVNSEVIALSASPHNHVRKQVLLATAWIMVASQSGRALRVRALLDQGSEVTFISERLAQTIRCKRIRMPVTISAVGGVDAGTCRYASHIEISPCKRATPVITATALILPHLTAYSPPQVSCDAALKEFSKLPWADESPMSSHPIDILLGSDVYGEILLGGLVKSPVGNPIAQQTIFGWVISGPVLTTARSRGSSERFTSHHCSSAFSLDESLKRFWEIEEIPQISGYSSADDRCEEHFRESHTRDAEGRYIVRLPFKTLPPLEIGESKSKCEAMFRSLSRRLQGNEELRNEYSEFMSEYERLGHMAEVPPELNSVEQTVMFPHHPVLRESSLTSKLRVVFNASCATSNGTSLNDHLLAGPKLQADLPSVVLRWRQFRFVYSADVAKMYRQIRVDPRDARYQRILWKRPRDTDVKVFELKTVTYGTASAPFLALRVVKQLANDEGSNFPLAKTILQNHMYVDDVLFGSNDDQTVIDMRNQLIALLHRGGFELRKWASNAAHLLADINSDNHGLACQKNLDHEERLKILGITWSPSSDCFHFRVTAANDVPKTKRTILSAISQFYDPLGWVTPATIKTKILMQTLWRLKIGWDEELPSSLFKTWCDMYSQLPFLNEIKIARWTNQLADDDRLELHGFADASAAAYAAVVYLKTVSPSGQSCISILTGKSKVAPVKPLTIPKLELSAALLLSRLISFVRQSIPIPAENCHCWTDSSIVLSWLSRPATTWKTFVANRVSSIHSSGMTLWHHVPSNENPADCASRGLLAKTLCNFSLWWSGPPWLKLAANEWPTQISVAIPKELLELRSALTHISTRQPQWALATQFSTWPKLIRVTAYLIKFIDNCRFSRGKSSSKSLVALCVSADQCQRAKTFWIRSLQRELFSKEIADLSNHRALSSKSSLLSLNPFLDQDGLLRVGGRLANAPVSFNVKHPIILAAHPTVSLIVRHAHHKALHSGLSLTLATLRQEFWILRGRTLTKNVLYKCVTCAKQRADTPRQLMGNLPASRVSRPLRSFLHCGLDYAGPLSIRASHGRGSATRKAYIALFVCLATRAIHLELVGTYSTASFLDAYSRFCARRGSPSDIYSDNGTTFVGADKELATAFKQAVQNPEIQNAVATDAVHWHFIPPSAPHFGGLWEAGVKSIKFHLRRVLTPHALTFEEFSTLLCRIEACVNSRPIAPLKDSVDDLQILTPGHFLIGSAITLHPEPTLLNLQESRLSRWQLVHAVTERFWKLWQTDYINQLQQRSKWQTLQENVQPGRIVLLRRPDLPPCKWELGRITQTHPGADGLIRVVTVKTATSEFKRPLVKLCLLPVETEKGSSEPSATSY